MSGSSNVCEGGFSMRNPLKVVVGAIRGAFQGAVEGARSVDGQRQAPAAPSEERRGLRDRLPRWLGGRGGQ